MSFAFMPLYTGDYRRDTQHLSMLEHGCYCLLLMHCWDQRGPVPLDERRIFGICNARSNEEMGAVRHVLAEFFTRMEDGHYNKRIHQEIQRAAAISQKRAEVGRKGALVTNTLKQKKIPAIARQMVGKSSASATTFTTTTTTTEDQEIVTVSNETVTVDSGAVDLLGKSAIPNVPHVQIIALYAQILPELPQIRGAWTGQRAVLMRSRWREMWAEHDYHEVSEGLDYWQRFFEHVRTIDLLMGKKTNWRAWLEWMLRPSNFQKIVQRVWTD